MSDSDRSAGQGDEVLVKYTGRLEDGTVFDSNFESKPKAIQIGAGEVIDGFDKALRGMRPGDKKTATVPPEEAFGLRDERLVLKIPPQEGQQLKKGQVVQIRGGSGPIAATVVSVSEDGVVLDANPTLASKTLIFDIEMVGFKPPLQRGVEMVGWGGKKLQVPNVIADSRVTRALEKPQWPSAWPYSDSDFSRQDETEDLNFYSEPRFVTHIDSGAIGAIRDFYAAQFDQAPQGEYSVLDICSSWISHYPKDLKAKRVAITGMVEAELKANKQATEWKAEDLNVTPKLPFGDNEFDFVTNVVSVDYLTKPREIFKEMHRVLKPGGVAIMSFSNRCFPSKAISMWVANMADGPGHCQIIGNYFHFNPEGGWRDISSADISPNPGRSDPMWVVTAVKA